MTWQVLQGDCLKVMAELPDASVDAVVCDPPAGISFMGKSWDGDKGGRDRWIEWLSEVMAEALRVCKPGAHALVWAIPRTSHWTATALEDAGWEVRDRIAHHFGTGFPKSHDVSKAIDRAGGESPKAQAAVLQQARVRAGLSRSDLARIVGCTTSSVRDWEEGRARVSGGPVEFIVPSADYREKLAEQLSYSADERRIAGVTNDRRGDRSVMGLGHTGRKYAGPSTPEAARWEGFGTALKPATEDWWLCRKPLSGTVAETVLEYGTGALNIDGCRLDTPPQTTHADGHRSTGSGEGYGLGAYEAEVPSGRWPANATFSHAEGCVPVGASILKGDQRETGKGRRGGGFAGVGADRGDSEPNAAVYGTETVEAWECVPGCPVAELDAQSGERPSGGGAKNRRTADGWEGGKFGPRLNETVGGDHGTASRFFYCSKSSRAEREAGLDGFASRVADPYGEHRGHRMEDKSRIDGKPAKEGRNHHPTVKSINLMRWLVRLVTPPRGTVLDCFAGSGSTGCAAVLEGFDFIGIEREEEYVAIAEPRIAFWAQHVGREVEDVLQLHAASRRVADAHAERGQEALDLGAAA